MAPSPKKAFPLRIDPALFAAIERTASADLRSANAQIEVLLREALTRRGVKLAAAEPVKRGRPPKIDTENSDG
ncbi:MULTISPECIES: hypothetical protein [Novosphingobium]|jgi:hypothetical protein|uniref:Toxin-antitoxin system HicB family antitoxin n=1 Tax=Novosphingobium subterraneum TaxID=48936 RepID=A0A0B9A2D7_9SPHN|nr:MULTISPECIES: hypothetical protein [Novosphingobium]KHS43462.1 hypothetical protein NJ75_03771 [Novosphingobium subterraneum]QOV94064.1 toxin-antitoxin system HicB family antitoxin [Novosphingobium sp. ES2-1]